MTREHKLALIVGFSLVLVLGVLISDHFSKAGNVQAAAASATTGQARDFGGQDPLRSTGPATVSSPGPGAGTAVPPPSDQPRMTPAPEVLAQGPGRELNRSEVVRPASPDPSMRPIDEIAMNGRRTPLPGSDTALTSMRNTQIPGGSGAAQPLPSGGAAPAPSNPSGLPVSREKLARHEVVDGDSIYRIAQKMYNDGNLWVKIRDYAGNKGKIGDNGAMREGVTILLPPKDVLLGKAVLADERVSQGPAPVNGVGASPGASAGSTPATTTGTSRTESNDRSGVKTSSYTVASGDTLAEIARKKLGSVRRIQDIIDLNKGTLDDPDSLKVGMVIRLPAR